jgi:hypothetical protein
MALHCHRIAFLHPRGGHRIELHAPLDREFQRLLGSLGLRVPAS